MKFTITGSLIDEMNGEYEVYQYGLVKNLTQDRLPMPAIDRVVKWMCGMAGEGGLIWIGFDFCALRPENEKHIMNALGFGDWPYCVLGEVEDE